MNHRLTVRPERRLTGTWFRAVCSCGYRSGLHGFPGHAERAGRDHMKAKRHNDLEQALRQMTVPQLREHARQNGMSSITRLDRKAELVAAILRYQATRGNS